MFQDIFKIYEGHARYPYDTNITFIEIARQYDIVVATMCLTMSAITDVTTVHLQVMPAYYVQDYEPWFFYSHFEPSVEIPLPRDKTNKNETRVYNRLVKKKKVKDELYKFSLSTYDRSTNNNAVMFAKTKWLVDTVTLNHGKDSVVHKVVPSIDHSVYFPDRGLTRIKQRKTFVKKDVFRIIAMIRPRSPRRNALGTLDVILRLLHQFGNRLHITLFGCEQLQIYETFSNIVEKFGNASHRNQEYLIKSNVDLIGLVSGRTTMSSLFRRSDIFIDMSWWQAFGRTGVEAMACGCIPVMPLVGAAVEVCDSGNSCLYHDGMDFYGFYKTVVELINNNTQRVIMMDRGLQQTEMYTIRDSAQSIIKVLQTEYIKWVKKR